MTAAPNLDDPRGWARVVNGLLERVSTGELKPGEEVQPRTVLAAELDVSTYAASQALRYLAGQGIVRLTPKHSYAVTPSARERAAALTAGPRSGLPVTGSACAGGTGTEVRGVERASGELAWVRVADLVLARIGTGEYAGRLPGIVGVLAAEAGVTRGTVSHALRDLAERGVVYRVAGHGHYVHPRAARAAAAPRRAVTLDDLVLAWGAGWGVGLLDGTWHAWRLDGRGDPLAAGTADGLNALIREREVAAR